MYYLIWFWREQRTKTSKKNFFFFPTSSAGQSRSFDEKSNTPKMTMTREMLKRGFLFTDIGEMMRWRDSYHETDSFAFAGTTKNIYCDTCGNLIQPGSLYSLGNRQVRNL